MDLIILADSSGNGKTTVGKNKSEYLDNVNYLRYNVEVVSFSNVRYAQSRYS